MRMHNPPHPGEILKTLCLEPLGLTVTQAAEALGVSRKTLSAIVNGRAGIVSFRQECAGPAGWGREGTSDPAGAAAEAPGAAQSDGLARARSSPSVAS